MLMSRARLMWPFREWLVEFCEEHDYGNRTLRHAGMMADLNRFPAIA